MNGVPPMPPAEARFGPHRIAPLVASKYSRRPPPARRLLCGRRSLRPTHRDACAVPSGDRLPPTPRRTARALPTRNRDIVVTTLSPFRTSPHSPKTDFPLTYRWVSLDLAHRIAAARQCRDDISTLKSPASPSSVFRLSGLTVLRPSIARQASVTRACVTAAGPLLC